MDPAVSIWERATAWAFAVIGILVGFIAEAARRAYKREVSREQERMGDRQDKLEDRVEGLEDRVANAEKAIEVFEVHINHANEQRRDIKRSIRDLHNEVRHSLGKPPLTDE